MPSQSRPSRSRPRVSGPALDAPDVADLTRVCHKRLSWEVEELAGRRLGRGYVSDRIARRWRSPLAVTAVRLAEVRAALAVLRVTPGPSEVGHASHQW